MEQKQRVVRHLFLNCCNFDLRVHNDFSPVETGEFRSEKDATVIAVQPNVPMSGLNTEKWEKLRERHVELAEEHFE